MTILTSQLPSGGFGYDFPSINVSPMNFLTLTQYLENVPKDPLEKYLYDIKNLEKEDPNILNCYVMDLDFLIFYKKLCTVSGDLSYEVSVTCPDCGKVLKKKINLDKDIHFKQIDPKVMSGAIVELGGHKYDTGLPTVREFLGVFEKYLRYRKVTDLKMIKTIALIRDFELKGNQIEEDVLEATHEDITLLMALRDLYYDRVEPITLICPNCKEKEEGGLVTMSVENLIVDFFRDLYRNCPIDGTKILFK